MSADEYWTLAEPGSAQLRVLGSRFLGCALPSANPEDAARRMDDERKTYHDATHWCWAARWGTGEHVVEKSSDAGEPHGTAGLPILREIHKRDLTDCLVIVTRYFGGTKLGRGNLARAYGESASLALDAAWRVLQKRWLVCRAFCPFDEQSIVYRLAQRHQAHVELLPSAGDASFRLRVLPSELPVLQAALTEESRGRIRFEQES